MKLESKLSASIYGRCKMEEINKTYTKDYARNQTA